jgi:hypothetical protein
MTNHPFIHSLRRRSWAAGLGLLLLAPSLASAQRAFVSAQVGNDANPCTVTSPCRTFGKALSSVAAGGEVIALDSGGYGPVTITQAVSINIPIGIYAGITVASGNGVTISAGASDTVVLKGLTINGAGGDYGVYAGSVGTLRVEGGSIQGFPSASLAFLTAGSYAASDVILRNNGVAVSIGAGARDVTVVRSRIENSETALNAAGLIAVSMRQCIVAGGLWGVIAAYASVEIDECLVSGLGSVAVTAALGSTVRLSDSTITDSFKALNTTNTGVIETYGNNRLRGNANASTGTINTVSRS